jgi:putative endonuclease
MIIAYILYSDKLNKYYTGQTQDLENRLLEHNNGETKFMKQGAPWQLIHSIVVATRQDALMLEKKIKGRGAKRFLTELNSSA